MMFYGGLYVLQSVTPGIAATLTELCVPSSAGPVGLPFLGNILSFSTYGHDYFAMMEKYGRVYKASHPGVKSSAVRGRRVGPRDAMRLVLECGMTTNLVQGMGGYIWWALSGFGWRRMRGGMAGLRPKPPVR